MLILRYSCHLAPIISC